jgi:hypothetical protein
MAVRRGVGVALAAVVSAAAGGALVACFDLFHATSDVETACELDAGHAGCFPAVNPDAIDTDFCAYSPAQAQKHAAHACSWLGACESPMGNNAFGPCYFRALMAYDCAANPDHRTRNEAHRLWDCLQRVRSCGDVDTCVFGSRVPTCAANDDYTACAPAPVPLAVRVHCSDGGGAKLRPSGENCALWGQTCATGPEGTACAGETTGLSCTDSDRSCVNRTSLHWCEATADGGIARDLGIDCTSYGSTCGGFPVADAAYWTACNVETDASDGAASCEPDASATCENGRAVSCPSGVVESLDCAGLLRSPNACNPGALDPPFDWTSSCSIAVPECASDSCDGMHLTSCERGANFYVDCASTGLGSCQLVSAEPGAAPRATCTAPSP